MNQIFALALLVLTLGSESGNLCLKSSGIPIQDYAIPEAVFPFADQQALETGIPAASPEGLQGLLEDFLS